MNSENYMDQFWTPEEYIIARVSSRTQRDIQKSDLIKIAKEHGCEADEKLTKKQLTIMVANKISYQKLAELVGVGVTSTSFQIKFDISHDEVKRMARLGFIRITGKYKFRAYGDYRYADTYSVYDYFSLTYEDVHRWLALNPKGTRKKLSERKK